MPTLTYCTNVHPGERLAEVESSLDRLTRAVARGFSGDATFPLGLHLSAAAIDELRDPARLARFRDFLAGRRFELATLNCFPYGGFHAERVKLDVYRPGWLERERVDYTRAAARVAAALAGPGKVVPISTLAGTCKLTADDAATHRGIAQRLAGLAVDLDLLMQESGCEVVVCLEPEPFTTLETSEECVRFFRGPLQEAAAQAAFAAEGGAPARAAEAIARHVALCWDCCHQAVEFEEPRAALATLAAAGVRIGKVQISSAVVAGAAASRDAQLAALRALAEPRWLHQSFLREADGAVARHLDLDGGIAALADASPEAELRVHFHVPIDRADLGPLATTRAEWIAGLRAVRAAALCDCFEVETYTLPRLSPDAEPRPLVEVLIGELQAARAQLAAP